MEHAEAILLNSHFTNKMKINGEAGWFPRDYNASTGYTWKFRPDNSGVYEAEEELILHPSTDAVGVPGQIMWKFRAIREGEGKAMFELFPPGRNEAVETVIVTIIAH